MKDGQTYSLWVSEAEVAPEGGSLKAPDLVALVEWRGKLVFESAVSRGALVGHWEPFVMRGGDLIGGGPVNTSAVQNVGRVRLQSGESVVVGVFDERLVSRRFLGGFEVPLAVLHLGVNEIKGGGWVSRLQITVAPEDGNLPKEVPRFAVAHGVRELSEMPASMKDRFARTNERLEDLVRQGVERGKELLDKVLGGGEER